MTVSERVLSGSMVKGTRATEESEVIPFYQGINVHTIGVESNRLNPQLRSGDIFGIFRDNTRMRSATFDDTITLNNTLDDLRNFGDYRFEQRVVFDLEKANFGVPPTTPQDEPFADLIDFDPVVYLTDEGTFMYPSNLWNLGELPKHEFDGLTEVFDKRKNILGQVDFRYEGRTSRGSLVGAASERPWGSKEIEDTWYIYDNQDKPFLDAPIHYEYISRPQPPTITTTTTETLPDLVEFWRTVFTLNGNTYSSPDYIQLWGSLDASSPKDKSGREVSITNTGFLGSTAVLGDAEYPSLYQPIGTNVSLRIGTAEYWNSLIGDKVKSSEWVQKAIDLGDNNLADRVADWPLQPDGSSVQDIIRTTLTLWVKITEHQTATRTVFFLFGGTSAGASNANIEIDYANDTYTDIPNDLANRPAVFLDGGGNPEDLYSKRVNVRIRPVDLSMMGDASAPYPATNYGDFYVSDWNPLGDSQWHQVTVVMTIDNRVVNTGDPANPGPPESNCQIYIDGQPVTTTKAKSQFTNDDEETGDDPQHFHIHTTGHSDPATRGDAPWSNVGARPGETSPSAHEVQGEFTLPAIWDSALADEEVEAIYDATRLGRVPQFNTITTVYEMEYGDPLKSLPVQGFQDIIQSPDISFLESDYHDRVYFSLLSHNNSDMHDALRKLNSSSCRDLTDPFEKRARSGIDTDEKAGSIVFTDSYVPGESK